MNKNFIKAISVILSMIMLVFAGACDEESSSKDRIEAPKKVSRVTSAENNAESITIGKTSPNGIIGQPQNTEKIENTREVKFGFIFLHDKYSSFDHSFIEAAKKVCKEMNVEYIIKTNVKESYECMEAAEELIDENCNVIFANSFGHETFLIETAKEYPEVQFCHAAGTRAGTENLGNYQNAYAAIYEGRYLTGIAAGMKLNEMINNGEISADKAKLGFVGSFTYAEVISAYTAFYLGAKSVCPTVTMEVMFTGSWFDEAREKEAASALINNGCKVISQYSDSYGAPNACEAAGIPNVAYNINTKNSCPNTFLISSYIDWEPYFRYVIGCMKNGEDIQTDWCGDFKGGSVGITSVNSAVAAPGTVAKINDAKAKMISGEIHVFDTDTFTVNGQPVNSYLADVKTDQTYSGDTEVISGGKFNESVYRSAPYFDMRIDGITILNETY